MSAEPEVTERRRSRRRSCRTEQIAEVPPPSRRQRDRGSGARRRRARARSTIGRDRCARGTRRRRAARSGAATVPPPAVAAPQLRTADAPTARRRSISEAHADELSLEQKPRGLRHLRRSERSFQRIKRRSRSGQRPPAASVNVDALVNYFAGAAGKRAATRRDARSRSARLRPSRPTAITRFLRFTIDTPRIDVGRASRLRRPPPMRARDRDRTQGRGELPPRRRQRRRSHRKSALLHNLVRHRSLSS